MPIGLVPQAFSLGIQLANTATTKPKPDKPGKEGDVTTNKGKGLAGNEVDVFWEYDGKEWKEISKGEYQKKTNNYNYITSNQEPDAASLSGAIRYPDDLSVGVDSDYVLFEFFEYQPPFKDVDATIEKNGAEQAAGALRWAADTFALVNPLAGAASLAFKIEDKLNVDSKNYSSRSLSVYNQSNDDERFYKKTSRNSIILYMPEDISTGYRAQWSGKKFTGLARSALTVAGAKNPLQKIENSLKGLNKSADNIIPQTINKAIRESIGAIGGDSISADELYGGTNGVIINPNVELLFGGHDLRNFTLRYKLVPRNDKEAGYIKTIINTFRAAMLPNFADGDEITLSESINVAQNFIKVPNVCKVSFMRGGDLNRDVPQYKMCAMTQVDVNYTPDGTYATLEDGTMVAYELTISFQETKLIFSEEVEKY